MKTWQMDQITALHSVNNVDDIFRLVAALARDCGFDHCAFGLRFPLPVSNPRTVLLNDYPLSWQQQYQQNDYLAIDPTVRHGLTSLRPILWSEQLFKSAKNLWEDARAFGLRFGWAQSNRDANGSVGMLSLSRSHDDITEKELLHKEFALTWLAQLATIRLSEMLTKTNLPEAAVELSPRELEVLRWTAEGKTSGEISDILGIAERTVNFHINNSVTKLNASNKTSAAIRASMVGLLN